MTWIKEMFQFMKQDFSEQSSEKGTVKHEGQWLFSEKTFRHIFSTEDFYHQTKPKTPTNNFELDELSYQS